VFIDLTGGSIGFQVGVQETDVVLVFTTKKGVETIYNGKLTLGGNASVAAGPVGRQGEAAVSTDAEVLSYSITRGLFAGVSMDGTAVTMNNSYNRDYYGKADLVPADVTSGKVTRNDSATVQRFLAALKASTGDAAPAAQASAPAAPDSQPAPAAPSTAPAEGARTFPMEDRSPGAEPPK
jgi:lipid-binding SYLF domain-containing protein